MSTLRTFLALTTITATLLAAGCSTTDDPSKGGLISYWTHGEDAYQERLEERQALLEQARSRSAATEEETAELQAQLAEKREDLERLETRLTRLRADLQGLSKESTTMGSLTAEAQQDQRQLQKDLAALQEEARVLATAEPDDDTPVVEQIQEREKRIADLERELKALRERASLLTTL